MEYIPQFLENVVGVVEFIPQLLQHSLLGPPNNWWMDYIIQMMKEILLLIHFIVENNTILKRLYLSKKYFSLKEEKDFKK